VFGIVILDFVVVLWAWCCSRLPLCADVIVLQGTSQGNEVLAIYCGGQKKQRMLKGLIRSLDRSNRDNPDEEEHERMGTNWKLRWSRAFRRLLSISQYDRERYAQIQNSHSTVALLALGVIGVQTEQPLGHNRAIHKSSLSRIVQ